MNCYPPSELCFILIAKYDIDIIDSLTLIISRLHCCPLRIQRNIPSAWGITMDYKHYYCHWHSVKQDFTYALPNLNALRRKSARWICYIQIPTRLSRFFLNLFLAFVKTKLLVTLILLAKWNLNNSTFIVAERKLMEWLIVA